MKVNLMLVGQQLMKKEPEEQENYWSTEKNEDLQDLTQEGTQYNSSIDQEVENNSANINGEDSQTTKRDSEAEQF